MTDSVFITGIAGFLGSNLADAYLQAGWHVTGIDNMSGGLRENVPSGAELREADCLDRKSYADLARGADVVFHCASAAYDGFSVFAPSAVYLNTLQSTVEVTTASLNGRFKRFVLCSSMARYGKLVPPFTEDQDPQPVTPYGWAKLSAEHAVKNLCALHDRDFAIAVPHNIIGIRQNYWDPYRNVAAIMINRILRGRQPVIYGDGSQVRCFSFVDDVVRCLVAMGSVAEASCEVINVGPDEGAVSILELARCIAEILNFDLDPIFVAARPHEVPTALCSADKARKLLGYETRSNLRDGLAKMAEWIASRDQRDFVYDREIEIASRAVPGTWSSRLI